VARAMCLTYVSAIGGPFDPDAIANANSAIFGGHVAERDQCRGEGGIGHKTCSDGGKLHVDGLIYFGCSHGECPFL
jgi:hypothetical protein